MAEVFQPSLFESGEQTEGHQKTQSLDLSKIPSRVYDSTRDPSQAALDQGWGWQPSKVADIDMSVKVEAVTNTDVSPDHPESWQPPTEEQKKRIRALVAATRESLRQKQP